jgi:crotonobetainyl-CoA:carnitine CoA-transferase CaiB-like acyl-CoA transferase
MLDNLKVLELASVLAGPSVGQFFAELGAEVIKVENTHTNGDVTRTWKVKGEKTDDRSSYFCSVNWGKKSIALDLTSAKGKDIVHALVKKSDVVIVSYKSGDAEKLNVDYKTLASLNPSLIYGQITGYGSHNPRVGYDAVIQAEAGFMFMNGEVGGTSLKMPVALMDILAAHQLKEGMLLALLKREKTGEGEFVEVSLIQSAIASLANQATNWLVAGMIPQKQGSAHPNIAPYGDVFQTADNKEILLAIGSDGQFSSLCKILAIPEISGDANYKTNQSRVENRPALNVVLQKRIAMIHMSSFSEALNAANIPYGIIKNIPEVFEMPEAKSLFLHSRDRKGIKTYVGRSLSGDILHFLPPPSFGEHTYDVLSKSLEMTSEQIKTLIRDGTVI